MLFVHKVVVVTSLTLLLVDLDSDVARFRRRFREANLGVVLQLNSSRFLVARRRRSPVQTRSCRYIARNLHRKFV